jgi:hypothetical protein
LVEALEGRRMLAADLTVSLSRSGFELNPGATLALSVTERNRGDAPADNFSTVVVLSTDAVVGNGDDVVLLTLTRSGAALAAGATERFDRVVTIDSEMVPGEYYLLAKVDSTGVVAESDEGNNTDATSEPAAVVRGDEAGPDVTVSSVMFSRGTLQRNDVGGYSILATTTLRNSTSVAAEGFTVRWVLSRDRTIGNADDVELVPRTRSVFSLAANETFAFQQTLDAVVPELVGGYNLLVKADSGNDVSERAEGNNLLLVLGRPVTVPTLADLTISYSGGGTVRPGQTVGGSITIRNGGEDSTPGFRYRVFLSLDGVLGAGDLLLIDGAVGVDGVFDPRGLAGKERFSPPSLSVPLPLAATPGSYRVIAVVDPTGSVEESNETNNTFVSDRALVIVPARDVGQDPATFDLSAAVTAEARKYVPGEFVEGALRVSNTGASAVARPAVRVVLTTNRTIGDADDVLVTGDFLTDVAADGGMGGGFGNAATFGPGSAVISTRVRIPEFAPDGAYFVAVVLDPGNELGESNEANNTVYSPGASVRVERNKVSVNAIDLTATEAAPTNGIKSYTGQFTFTRTGPTNRRLSINFAPGGTADSADYNAQNFNLGVVEFAPGEVSKIVEIRPGDDDEAEGPETVTVAVGRGPGYTVDLLRQFATVTIEDNEPFVSVTAPAAAVAEGSARPAVFTLVRGGRANVALDVRVRFVGSATYGADYSVNAADFLTPPTDVGGGVFEGVVRLAAGQSSAPVRATVLADAVSELGEAIGLEVVGEDDGTYGPGPSPVAEVSVGEASPVVSVVAAAAVREGGTGTITVSRVPAGAAAGVLDVLVRLTGSAVLGTDYAVSGATLVGDPAVDGDAVVVTVRIAQGASAAGVTVTALQNQLARGPRTLTATPVRPGVAPAYAVAAGARGVATVALSDDEPTVTVTAGQDFSENGGVGTVTLTRSVVGGGAGLGVPLDVTVRFGGSATLLGAMADYAVNAAEYVTPPALVGDEVEAVVRFAAGQSVRVLRLTAVQDTAAEGPEGVTVGVVEEAGPGANAVRVVGLPAGIFVQDDEAPGGGAGAVVSIRATDASAVETAAGAAVNGATFVLTRSSGVGAVTVGLNVGGSATLGQDFEVNGATPGMGEDATLLVEFGEGQLTRTVTVLPTGDTLVEGLESVVLRVVAGAGYAPSNTVFRAAATIADAALSNLVLDDVEVDGASTLSVGTPGQSVEVSGRVTNTGSTVAGASAVRVVLTRGDAPGGAGDVVLATRTIVGAAGGLGAGESVEFDFAVNLDAAALPNVGMYRLFVVLVGPSGLREASAADNLFMLAGMVSVVE